MSSSAWQTFKLPNGIELKNRVIKAAMEENIGDAAHHNQPSEDLQRLYGAWAKGGVSLILSGHIMIDPTGVGSPANPILSKETLPYQDEQRWRDWISAAQAENTKFLFQINHPGRQARKGTGLPTYGASPIAVNVGPGSSAVFETPIEMSEQKIQDIIERFSWTAKKAEELGADGVEIHAAHGYLISSFLSPKSNVRTDQWGGSLANRARLLFATIKSIRAATSPAFILGVKINTADFQRGGFDRTDLKWVVEQLNDMNVDFVEASGGSYESPAMMGAGKWDPSREKKENQKSESTKKREAYFLEAAEELQGVAKMPLIVTGGIARKETLDMVVQSSQNVLAGLGTAMGVCTDLPKRWENGEDVQTELAESWFLPKSIASMAKIAQVQCSLQRVGAGQEACQGIWPSYAVVAQRVVEATQLKQYKAWVQTLLKERGAVLDEKTQVLG